MWTPLCLTALKHTCLFHSVYSQYQTRTDSWMKTHGAEKGSETLKNSLTNGGFNIKGCKEVKDRGREVSRESSLRKFPQE